MFNKAVLIGRLTADPELKQTQSGISVCGFSIAVDRRYGGQGGEKKTDFINITAWRRDAEFVCNYFRKGSVIGVEGSIQSRKYVDRDGNSRTAVEVVADHLFFTGPKSSGSGSPAPPAPAGGTAPPAEASYSSGSPGDFEEMESDNDLPF